MKIPYVRGNLFLGVYPEMVKKGVHFYPEIQSQYGDVVEARVGLKKAYLFFHPKEIFSILTDSSDIFIKGKQYDTLRKALGNGLLTAQGPYWEQQRKMLNPIFNKAGLDQFAIQIDQTIKEFLDDFKPSSSTIDANEITFSLTLKVAIKSFLGSESSREELDQMYEDTSEVIKFVSRKMANRVKKGQEATFKIAQQRIEAFILKSYLHKNSLEDPGKDILGLLINHERETKKKFEQKQIYEIIMSFLFAGHETTATTLSWLLFHIAKDNSLQSKLNDEIKSMPKTPLLNAAIKETMRLYPAGWVISRNLTETCNINGYTLKKNRIIVMCPFVTHRDPRWWNEPEKFVPERFLSEEISNLPKGAYLPFSLGKRNCIGARFAELEMTLFIARFLERYEITTNMETVGLKGFVTLKSDRKILLTLKVKTAH